MSSIFSTLGVGYSALSAAQVGISTTGHNIANAETEGYTRQRVVQTAATPIALAPGNVGNGVQIDDIKRIFDNFVFDRYSAVSGDKEYSDFEKQTLEQLSTFFPEIDGVGIKAEMATYYDMWQTFADNPEIDSIKIALAQQTQTLSQHISQNVELVENLQSQMNEQLVVNVNQVNELAEQLAGLNIEIEISENTSGHSANDLRDKRNVLERNLSRLVGADVTNSVLTADINIHSNSNTTGGSYTLSINGFNIVDGSSFHPLHITNKDNPSGFYEVSYERQDGVKIPLEETITGGKIGAIFDLRGGTLDTTSGVPTDGILQNVITQLNSLAKGMIEGTNNLYANNAREKMESNALDVDAGDTLLSSGLNIKSGSFDILIYDIDGNEVAKRNIKIDHFTSMSGLINSNSIEGQILANLDDNADNSANNDVDDFLLFSYTSSATGEKRLNMNMDPAFAANGYTFAIADNLTTNEFASGSNFAGAIGLGRFFEGDSAKNMNLAIEHRNNPTGIESGYSSNTGDNRVALDMVQQQFEKYNFKVADKSYESTVYGMYDITTTFVGISTNSAITRNETISTEFNSTQMEYDSTSKVSIDEELTNLIKYQTSYGAAAKIITTVDQMMQTLLGIKQ